MQEQEKIGEFLVRIGAITTAQRDEILEIQKKEPDKLFGYIAIELKYLDDSAIEKYVNSKH
jgi:hypothetical protein